MVIFIIILIFSLLYVVIGLKVKQWEVIKTLGFPSETPEGYLRDPLSYKLIRTTCFVIALIAVVMSPFRYSAALGFPLMGLLWYLVNNRGLNRGIKEYRRVMKETVDYYESNPSEEKDEFYEHAKKSLKINDAQIHEIYKEKARKRKAISWLLKNICSS